MNELLGESTKETITVVQLCLCKAFAQISASVLERNPLIFLILYKPCIRTHYSLCYLLISNWSTTLHFTFSCSQFPWTTLRSVKRACFLVEKQWFLDWTDFNMALSTVGKSVWHLLTLPIPPLQQFDHVNYKNVFSKCLCGSKLQGGLVLYMMYQWRRTILMHSDYALPK